MRAWKNLPVWSSCMSERQGVHTPRSRAEKLKFSNFINNQLILVRQPQLGALSSSGDVLPF